MQGMAGPQIPILDIHSDENDDNGGLPYRDLTDYTSGMWSIRNVLAGLGRVSLWSRLALTDIEELYKRSVLGMAWVALAFALFIFVKILIFGSITIIDERYFSIWLSIGFWVWTLFQSIVVEGSRTFLSARGWILGTKLPLSIYAIQVLTRALIRFSFSLPVVVSLFLFFKWIPTIEWLWSLGGIIAIVINGLWITLFLATLCSRYNDLIHLTQSVMRVMFFVTPILYVPEQMGDRAHLLIFNPFTHYIAIVRDPIMGLGIPILSWQVVIAMTVIGWSLTLLTYQLMGRNIALYVS